MESRAKFMGHAMHPILVVFPLGLLATSVVFDIIHLTAGSSQISLAAYWMITAGLIGGLLAAVPGWIDWFAIPRDTRAWYVGLIHGLGNVVVLLLFAGSWWLRGDSTVSRGNPAITAYIFSFAGASLAAFTGWLGGELVGRLGVGVDDGANLNASNSLKGTPADG
jgi:uncharacterized membrane protein